MPTLNSMTINGVRLAPTGLTTVADFKNNKLDINAEKTSNGFSISSLQQGNSNVGDIGTANRGYREIAKIL